MREDRTERKPDCFAYNAEGDRCTALTTICCANCAFYKSEEQMRAELLRLSARLTELQLRTKRTKGD